MCTRVRYSEGSGTSRWVRVFQAALGLRYGGGCGHIVLADNLKCALRRVSKAGEALVDAAR